MPSSITVIVSQCTVFPDQKSSIKTLKLSVSDLPMLSCHYIQKGILLPPSPFPFSLLISSLKLSLSLSLSLFPALAGRLTTAPNGYIYVSCNDAGVDFIQAKALHLSTSDLLSSTDVHPCFKTFFAFNKTLSYFGHHKPLAAVQVTELANGVFIGCTVNHAVADGTSFWHFFNSFAEIHYNKAAKRKISNSPDFCRDVVLNSTAVLKLPSGGPKETFAVNTRLRERIFHFDREAILKLKVRANNNVERRNKEGVISSFQSLCGLLWRAVTRARKLNLARTTTFRMAVNCRHRLQPPLPQFYFGNAIQSIPTVALAGDVTCRDLGWCGALLHENVRAHDNATVRRGVEDWEREPRVFPLGNADGASITMGSSPRFPMYDNDFGWGPPLAVRSGGANKFDGKISAFPGREGNGSVELEVVLEPETMSGLESDPEFMQYVSVAV